ncbi:hypothetical protein J6590_017007 [Homalodisca vitripennis]|nr:hypothetical protein J6590_017007 [Homalodisca vitripennis]
MSCDMFTHFGAGQLRNQGNVIPASCLLQPGPPITTCSAYCAALAVPDNCCCVVHIKAYSWLVFRIVLSEW